MSEKPLTIDYLSQVSCGILQGQKMLMVDFET